MISMIIMTTMIDNYDHEEYKNTPLLNGSFGHSIHWLMMLKPSMISQFFCWRDALKSLTLTASQRFLWSFYPLVDDAEAEYGQSILLLKGCAKVSYWFTVAVLGEGVFAGAFNGRRRRGRVKKRLAERFERGTAEVGGVSRQKLQWLEQCTDQKRGPCRQEWVSFGYLGRSQWWSWWRRSKMGMMVMIINEIMIRRARQKSGDRRGCSLLQISCSVETDLDEVFFFSRIRIFYPKTLYICMFFGCNCKYHQRYVFCHMRKTSFSMS